MCALHLFLNQNCSDKYIYPTNQCKLLEHIVLNKLSEYRINNTEKVECELDKIIKIIKKSSSEIKNKKI